MPKKALLVIDMQNDFCPGGSLEVAEGDTIIPTINKLKADPQFDLVVLTKDWHPANHMSFLSNNSDREDAKLFQPLDLGEGKTQVMWPDHCVQESKGSELHPDLKVAETDKIVFKGTNTNVDSYSGFYDNDKGSQTELLGILQEAKIDTTYVVGLAYDFCVGFTALDSKEAGFDTYVLDDCAKGVTPDGTVQMKERLGKAGVNIITSADVLPTAS